MASEQTGPVMCRCTPGREHVWEPGEWCPPVWPKPRPAAPSELPAADSPTPGPETHRMLAGSHEQPGGAECHCGAPWDRWNDRCTQPAIPSPVDTMEPPAETVEEMAARTGWPVELLNARVVFHPEPPAETQQDDEVEAAAAALWEAQQGVSVTPWAELSTLSPTRGQYRRYARAALAARPSADTETQRRVREVLAQYDDGQLWAITALGRVRAALDAR